MGDGTTGFLVDEGDSTGMARRLIDLATDARLRDTMGAAGWRVAGERYSWAREQTALHHLLKLNGGGGVTVPAARGEVSIGPTTHVADNAV